MGWGGGGEPGHGGTSRRWQRGRWALDKACAGTIRAGGNCRRVWPGRGLGGQLPVPMPTRPAQPITRALDERQEGDLGVALAASPDRWAEHLLLECVSAGGEGEPGSQEFLPQLPRRPQGTWPVPSPFSSPPGSLLLRGKQAGLPSLCLWFLWRKI